MRNNSTHFKKGFTLIELLVVVSIISLLSSIVFASLNVARNKAYDAKTKAEVQQVQNQIAIMSTGEQPLPDTGNTDTYYCVSKAPSETCVFWGDTTTGHVALETDVGFGNKDFNPRPIVIDGLPYEGVVYICTERNDDTDICSEAAIYWAESGSCSRGITVLSGVGGVVCGQDAGSSGTSNVEIAGGNGDFEVEGGNPTVGISEEEWIYYTGPSSPLESDPVDAYSIIGPCPESGCKLMLNCSEYQLDGGVAAEDTYGNAQILHNYCEDGTTP